MARLIIDSKIKEILKKTERISEILPRNSCKKYVNERTTTPVLLTKEEFDNLCREKQFKDGPHRDSFGDDYGEPYNPHKQAFGTLNSGEVVYCELNSLMQKKVNSVLESIVL